MKSMLLSTLILFLTNLSFSQAEVTLTGDVNDSTFLATVDKMKAAGFNVKINEPGPLEVRHTNNSLPGFELTDLKGNKLNSESLRGKKIHINIWSTSCKPCIEEFPELNKLRENYEEQEYVFIAMAPESAKKISKLLAKRPLEYLIIPEGQEYLDELGIDSFPVNFFVDENGIIRKIIHGASYKMEVVNGKEKMVPDNYDKYEKALLEL